MKNIFLISIVLLTISLSAKSSEPNFLVICVSNGDTAVKYADSYETVMESYLKEAFPCAKITKHSGIRTWVARERLNELKGNEIQQQLINIGNDLNWDYFVKLTLKTFEGRKIFVRASCLERNEFNCIADAGYQLVPMNYEGVKEGINKLCEQLIDKLSHYEICAFVGPVTLQVRTEKDTTMIEEYGVYCNESDQRYRKETKQHNLTTSDWKLERKGIPWTSGTMTFNSEESQSIVEENGCYKCLSSQREGGRTLTLKQSFTVNGSGISHLSVRNGKPQQDTRVVIEFLENDTYIIKPKGTSDPANALEKREEKAVGTCDNISPVKDESQKEITIPLKYPFGPYPGKSTDKFLQQTETKVFRDPVSNEKTTVTLDFSLKQKEK